jgi:hypothetical protein
MEDTRHPGASKTEGRGAAYRDAGDSQVDHMVATKRARGRPAGSKNKAKGLIPKEFAAEFLGVIKQILPPEHYEEMRAAIQEGKTISTLAEARITLKLMGPPIWQRLLEESRPKVQATDIDPDALEEIGGAPEPKLSFSRDLNERMKIYLSLIDFIDKSERRDDEATDSRSKPIIEVFARRGIDSERLRILVGVESGSVGGNANEAGGQSSYTRTIPDTLPERQVSVPDSEEIEADWVEHSPSGGSGVGGDDQAVV